MKISQTNDKQLKQAVANAATKAYKIAGYNVPQPTDLAEIVVLTAENLRKYFRNNQIDDIATAFEKGALGDYGENSGLSVARFHQWMRAFNGNGTNQQVADDEPPAAPQPPRDRVKDAHDMVNSAYAEWLRRGYNLIPASLLLAHLVSDGKLVEYARRKAAAERQAEATLNEQYFKKRAPFQKLSDFIKANQATEVDALIIENFFNELKDNGIKIIYQ